MDLFHAIAIYFRIALSLSSRSQVIPTAEIVRRDVAKTTIQNRNDEMDFLFHVSSHLRSFFRILFNSFGRVR